MEKVTNRLTVEEGEGREGGRRSVSLCVRLCVCLCAFVFEWGVFEECGVEAEEGSSEGEVLVDDGYVKEVFPLR